MEINALLARRRHQGNLGVSDLLDAVLTELRLRRWCAAWGNTAQRVANLDAIRNHINCYLSESQSRREAPSVIGFLRYVDRMTDDFGRQNKRTDTRALIGGARAITVSTWHRSKGLEWPVTLLYGLESLRPSSPFGLQVMSDVKNFDLSAPLSGRWIRYWPNPYATSNQNGPVRTAVESTDSFSDIVARADREALRVLYVCWTRARDQLILAVQRNKFTKGLLGKLGDLIEEPAEDQSNINWAGTEASLDMRVLLQTTNAPQAPVAGRVTMGREAIDHVPARSSPSSVGPVECSIGTRVRLGTRFQLKDGSDMEFVGNAVHAFLGADRRDYSMELRQQIAAELLERYRVADALSAESVVEASDRLWAWVDTQYPGGAVYREWPLSHKLESGTLVCGTADLLVKSSDGFAVVDHKTFPGPDAEATNRAKTYSGQLESYASAVFAATGTKVISQWIHFPILGLMMEILSTTNENQQ